MGCVESKDSRGKSRSNDSRSRPPPGPHDSRSRPPPGPNRQNTKVVKHPNGRSGEYKPRGGRYDDTGQDPLYRPPGSSGQDPLYRPPGSRPPPRHQSSEFNPRKDLMFPPTAGGQAVYPNPPAFISTTLSRKKGGGTEEARGYDTINRNRREAESRASNANSSFEIAKTKQDHLSASSTLPKSHSGNGIHSADRWSQSIDRRRREGDGSSDTIRRGEKNQHNISSENNRPTSRHEQSISPRHPSNTAVSINNNNSTAKTPSSKMAVVNGGETGASGGGTMRRASFDRSSQYRRSKRKRKKDSTVGTDSPAENLQVSNRKNNVDNNAADSSYLLKSSSVHHAGLISAPNDSYNPDASYNDLAITNNSKTGFNSTGLSNGEHSPGLPANNDSKSPTRPNTDPKYGNLI